MADADACQREVLGLHQFFEDWFAGRIDAGPDSFARCTNVLAPEFTLINPDGERTDRPDLLERLQAAHGHAGHTYFHIRIADVESRRLADGLWLVTYQEWQETDGFITARWSSAILREATGPDNGLTWVHVQETWIAAEDEPEHEPAATAQ